MASFNVFSLSLVPRLVHFGCLLRFKLIKEGKSTLYLEQFSRVQSWAVIVHQSCSKTLKKGEKQTLMG